jgi:hypothetical protein
MVVSQMSPEGAQIASEVSIAINPVNLNNLVGGSLVRGIPNSAAPNISYYSMDGGKTWRSVDVANPDRRTQGDDVVLFNQDGTAVHAFITFKGLWEAAPERAANGIALTLSEDGGQTWTGQQTVVVDHANTKSPMEDKPWLVFDRNRKSPHFGNLYCSWTRFDVYGSRDPQDSSQIMFAASVDGGKSFQPVQRIGDAGGDCLDDDGTVEGAVPCVHPDGTVFVIWAGPRGMEMDRSDDGGVSFGSDKTIGKLVGGWNSDVDGIGRHNGMPVCGVDHSLGPFRGSLYVTWIDERNADKDVFVMHSRDKGETWSDPVRVNDDSDENGRDQFFTWMAVDPVDGSINVAFYDRRETTGTKTRLTLARSVDGGETFKNIPINFPEFDCSNPAIFFGDYIGVDAIRGRVAVSFMHYTSPQQIASSSCVVDFLPGTLELLNEPPGVKQPSQITVQHILIAFDGTIPDKDIRRSKEQAETLAKELFSRAKSGEDFDKLVKDNTDDQHPGVYSMSNFWSPPNMNPDVESDRVYPRVQMVPGFGDVGFTLQVGEIGMTSFDPDTSKYGWHIIKRMQ